MGRKNLACEKLAETPEENINFDKARISYLKETLIKMLRETKNAKKMAQIIEEMMSSPTPKSNK